MCLLRVPCERVRTQTKKEKREDSPGSRPPDRRPGCDSPSTFSRLLHCTVPWTRCTPSRLLWTSRRPDVRPQTRPGPDRGPVSVQGPSTSRSDSDATSPPHSPESLDPGSVVNSCETSLVSVDSLWSPTTRGLDRGRGRSGGGCVIKVTPNRGSIH